jgi:hypothetical protein
MSKTFPEKIDKNFDIIFSSIFRVLSRFRVFLSHGSSKTLQKNVLQKIVSKSLQKNRPKKTNRIFLDFCLSRLWTFLGEGRSKTRAKGLDFFYQPQYKFFGRRGTNQPRKGPSVISPRFFFFEVEV